MTGNFTVLLFLPCYLVSPVPLSFSLSFLFRVAASHLLTPPRSIGVLRTEDNTRDMFSASTVQKIDAAMRSEVPSGSLPARSQARAQRLPLAFLLLSFVSLSFHAFVWVSPARSLFLAVALVAAGTYYPSLLLLLTFRSGATTISFGLPASSSRRRPYSPYSRRRRSERRINLHSRMV
jgi:hypothetical protein